MSSDASISVVSDPAREDIAKGANTSATTASRFSLSDDSSSSGFSDTDVANEGDSESFDESAFIKELSMSSVDLPNRKGRDEGEIPLRMEVLYAAMPSGVRESDFPISGMALQSGAIRLNLSRSLSKCGT